LNHQIERIIRGRKISLGKDDLVGRRARAKSQLETGRHGGLLSRRRAWLNHVLIQQVLKLSAPHLVPGGAGGGQIGGDVVSVEVLCRHSAGGAVECANHADAPRISAWIIMST